MEKNSWSFRKMPMDSLETSVKVFKNQQPNNPTKQ